MGGAASVARLSLGVGDGNAKKSDPLHHRRHDMIRLRDFVSSDIGSIAKYANNFNVSR
jgi:hypothetical protein